MNPLITTTFGPSDAKGAIQRPHLENSTPMSQFINQKTMEFVHSREPADPTEFVKSLEQHAFGKSPKKESMK